MSPENQCLFACEVKRLHFHIADVVLTLIER